jgi:hypothetical protein
LLGREVIKDWLIDWKKYLVRFEWKNKSLAEAREWRLIVIRNWL